jgi:hypothetical protein
MLVNSAEISFINGFKDPKVVLVDISITDFFIRKSGEKMSAIQSWGFT